MSKFLFPISLGNNTFSTENTLLGIASIPQEYDEIVCVIADQIQLYNKAMSVHDADELMTLIKKFRSGENLFKERSVWLERIKSSVSSNSNFNKKWTIYGFEDITDQTFNKIYRNVLIMYNSIIEFQEDVNDDAKRFILRKTSKAHTEEDIRLSTYYILEEIAASIKIHVCEDISDEYYLGKHLKCILKLFSSQYGVDVYSIANTTPRNNKWKFYDYSLETHQWVDKMSALATCV